ncbi:hypothetical protein PRIPAC_79658, partial [Pristionchus pacificus]|uniref:G protein-coupled receptor n=1 Tax=Pristionchus pacificus TaxID=54126 RepID=A0A2A6C235_PRIPA
MALNRSLLLLALLVGASLAMGDETNSTSFKRHLRRQCGCFGQSGCGCSSSPSSCQSTCMQACQPSTSSCSCQSNCQQMCNCSPASFKAPHPVYMVQQQQSCGQCQQQCQQSCPTNNCQPQCNQQCAPQCSAPAPQVIMVQQPQQQSCGQCQQQCAQSCPTNNCQSQCNQQCAPSCGVPAPQPVYMVQQQQSCGQCQQQCQQSCPTNNCQPQCNQQCAPQCSAPAPQMIMVQQQQSCGQCQQQCQQSCPSNNCQSQCNNQCAPQCSAPAPKSSWSSSLSSSRVDSANSNVLSLAQLPPQCASLSATPSVPLHAPLPIPFQPFQQSCGQCQQQCQQSCPTNNCQPQCNQQCAPQCSAPAPQMIVMQQPQQQSCGQCHQQCTQSCSAPAPSCQSQCNSQCTPQCSALQQITIQSPSQSMCAPSCASQCSSVCATPTCVSSCIPQCTSSCQNKCQSENECQTITLAIQVQQQPQQQSCQSSCTNSCMNQCQTAAPSNICHPVCQSQCSSACTRKIFYGMYSTCDTKKPLNVHELSQRWKFGDPFDNFVDASFILLPEWSSCRPDIDIALRRLKFEYLPSLAIYTFVDLPTYSSPIRSKFAHNEKCRQFHEISNLEVQCYTHEINYPKYKFFKEVVEIVDRELSRVRRMFNIIRKIIRNEKVIGYTISLGSIKTSTILKSIEDVEEFYVMQLTALSMRKKLSCENGVRLLPASSLPIIHHPPVFVIPVFPVCRTIITQNKVMQNIPEVPNLDGWWKNPRRNQTKIEQTMVKQPETKQPMDSFYLSPELQSFIINGQRILFIISIVLNCTAFVCLLKETPENQSRFRNYLLYIQILAAMNDINLDVLFEPFPLFPILGAFCNGIMCRLGIPIHYSFALSVFIVGNIGGSVLICFLYRHQSIVKDRSQMSKFPYGDLSWIRQRGMYELFVKTREIMLIPTVLILAYFLLIFMIQRIAANILGDCSDCKKEQTRTDCSTNTEFCLLSFHVITFHTTIHSVVLLLITPAYRRFIRNFLTSLLFPK